MFSASKYIKVSDNINTKFQRIIVNQIFYNTFFSLLISSCQEIYRVIFSFVFLLFFLLNTIFAEKIVENKNFLEKSMK